MNTILKLELQFATEHGKSRTLSVNQPAKDLDAQVVQDAMDTIVNQNIFEQDGIQLYNHVKGARYVTRTVDSIFEAEEA